MVKDGTEKDTEGKTFTKANIIDAVYELETLTKRDSADMVALVFEVMKETLEEGTKVKISGFGNFEVRQKDPRLGRNPKTKQVITIDGRRILKFKPSQILKEQLNANMPGRGPSSDD